MRVVDEEDAINVSQIDELATFGLDGVELWDAASQNGQLRRRCLAGAVARFERSSFPGASPLGNGNP